MIKLVPDQYMRRVGPKYTIIIIIKNENQKTIIIKYFDLKIIP